MKQENAEPVKLTKAAVQILETSIELFAAYGYYGTTMRHVAKKANVTPMTVYRLFKSKPMLFKAALSSVIAQAMKKPEFLQAIFDHKRDGGTRIFVTAAVRDWYDSVSAHPARLMMYACLSQNEKWQKSVYSWLDEIIAVLASTLDEALDKEKDQDKQARFRPKAAVAARSLILGLFQFKITHPTIKSAREERAAVGDILDQWWMGVFPEAR
ncbi:MAG TPA: TetR/AcrR family transcriptional regulator [Candidatus Angelobacter sp.]|jgi:AcrR family transcriptional regulator|nr:TetR/AcrR family transcriptional regulator [Candidatus Angelobacter sp.]